MGSRRPSRSRGLTDWVSRSKRRAGRSSVDPLLAWIASRLRGRRPLPRRSMAHPIRSVDERPSGLASVAPGDPGSGRDGILPRLSRAFGSDRRFDRIVRRGGTLLRVDRRTSLRLGLLCGVGAVVLLALQAVGRPFEGAAGQPSVVEPLPPSAFEPVRLPSRAIEAFSSLSRRLAAGGRAARLDRFGEEGDATTGAGTSATPAGPGAPAAAVPDRVLAGLQPPTIVRFRPRDGSRGVDPEVWLSVRFSAPMDRPSTERAFTALIGGRPIDGRRWWAEDDTVLVLDPVGPLPAGAEVRLAVGSEARSRIGLPLVEAVSATIRVAEASPATERSPPTATRAGAARTDWRWPLLGPITQGFGESVTRYGWHFGIDIDGATGDPVVAARAGRVTVAGRYDACGGLEVHIDHGDGFESWYRHLSVVETAVGARVAAGQRIGRVGNTGCSLGSHLHFAIRRDGVWVDPLRYLPPR